MAAIVPALNEAATIAAVVRGLAGVVSVIVVCDDGSHVAPRRGTGPEHCDRTATPGGKGRAVRKALTKFGVAPSSGATDRR